MTVRQRPVFLPAAYGGYFGIAAAREDHCGRTGVVLLPGAATPGFGNARIWVRVAEQLAEQGHLVMRLDFRGTGESSGPADPVDLDLPFVDEVIGAAQWLRGQGASQIVLMGLCFGARCALAAAPHIEGLRGMNLMFPPLKTSPDSFHTDDQSFVSALVAAAGLGVRIRFLYGDRDLDYTRFAWLRTRTDLGRLLEPPSLVDLELVGGRLHGLADADAIEAVYSSAVTCVTDFLNSGSAAVPGR